MSAREVLDSWKEISAYLGRDVRTCRRWEEHLGLPVHRLNGSPKARVRAFKDEVDLWLEKKLHEREVAAPSPLFFLRRWPVVVGLVAVLAVAVLGWITRPKSPIFVPGSSRPRLVVLPCVNLTDDDGLNYLRESFPGNVIRDLQASSEQLMVYSLDVVVDAVRRLGLEPGSPLTPEDVIDIATRTDADWFLLCSLTKSGSKLRIDYQLRSLASLSAPPGAPSATAPLKTDSVKGTEAGVLGIVDRVASGVRRAYGIPTRAASEVMRDFDQQASEFYDLARSVERKYSLTILSADLEQMLVYLERAREADPGCALVYLGFGDAYQHKFVYENRDQEALRLMKENYKRAYAMAPELAETNCGAGWVHFIEGDNDQAYALLRQALKLDPASIHILFEVGSFLRSIGLLEKAQEYYTKAIKAGGGTADVYFLRGWTYEQMGLYESALGDYDRMVKLEPLEWRPRLLRARVFILMKRYEAAAAELAMAESMEPGELHIALTRALVAAAMGRKDEALAAIAPERLGTGPGRGAVFRSRIYAALGMPDEALAAIERGIAHGFEEVYEYLFYFPFLNNTRDHFYDKLRNDPRFAKILERQESSYVDLLHKYSDL